MPGDVSWLSDFFFEPIPEREKSNPSAVPLRLQRVFGSFSFSFPGEELFLRFSSAKMTETLKISDGSTMEIARLPDVDDATWAELKAYVEGNPETAKTLQNFAKNPEAMRGWLQTQAIAEHYNTKLSNGDTPVQDKVRDESVMLGCRFGKCLD